MHLQANSQPGEFHAAVLAPRPGTHYAAEVMADVPKTEIPFEKLSAEALEGVIDDFILREGTDYGSYEATLDKKREDILRQLRSGRAKIVFEPETESITLIPVPK